MKKSVYRELHKEVEETIEIPTVKGTVGDKGEKEVEKKPKKVGKKKND